MQIIGTLAKIPDVVWSGLLASAFTLAGVMLSNWSNTKRLVEQISYESEEKKKDRINSLRKDVYLKAVEEMAKAGAYFGKIPQIDPIKVNIGDGLTDFFAAVAKLQLVSQAKTSLLAGELSTRYGEILFTLMAKASPIHNLNTQIRIAGNFYERNQAEVDRVIAEMTQLNESAQPNPVRFAALQQSYQSAQELANSFENKRVEAYEKHAVAMREYSIALLTEMRSVGELQVRLSVAIRSELSLATDTAEYEARMQAIFERMDSSLQGFLKKLEDGE